MLWIPGRKMTTLGLILLSGEGAAWADGQVRFPVALNLTPTSVPLLLGGVGALQPISGTIQTTLPDMAITSPYPVRLTGIHLTVNYALAPAEVAGSPLVWNLTSQALSATLTVDHIDASQVINVTSGGTTLQVTIQASCSGTRLDLSPTSAQATGTVDVGLANGALTLGLSQFSANWTPGAWTITQLNCSGPQGFGNLVAQAAEIELRSINPFLNTIESAVQSGVQQAASQLPHSWSYPTESGITLSLSPTALTPNSSGGVVVDALALLDFPAASTGCSSDLSDTPLSSPDSIGTDALQIPSAAAAPLVGCAYEQNALVASWTSDQFPAFKSLLGNFFLKLFIWPDLFRFSSKSQFSFGWGATSAPSVSLQCEDAQGRLTLGVTGTSGIIVSAPSAKGILPYTHFKFPVSGAASLSISGGMLSVQLAIKKLSLRSQWDPAYFAAAHPDGSIWTSVIASYLKSYLNANALQFALPVFTLNAGTTLGFSSLAPEGDTITLGLDFKD